MSIRGSRFWNTRRITLWQYWSTVMPRVLADLCLEYLGNDFGMANHRLIHDSHAFVNKSDDAYVNHDVHSSLVIMDRIFGENDHVYFCWLNKQMKPRWTVIPNILETCNNQIIGITEGDQVGFYHIEYGTDKTLCYSFLDLESQDKTRKCMSTPIPIDAYVYNVGNGAILIFTSELDLMCFSKLNLSLEAKWKLNIEIPEYSSHLLSHHYNSKKRAILLCEYIQRNNINIYVYDTVSGTLVYAPIVIKCIKPTNMRYNMLAIANELYVGINCNRNYTPSFHIYVFNLDTGLKCAHWTSPYIGRLSQSNGSLCIVHKAGIILFQ